MDIVERLRDPNKWAGTSDSDHNPLPSHAMALEAADEIEKLLGERNRLREAFKNYIDHVGCGTAIRCEHCDAARAALKGDE